MSAGYTGKTTNGFSEVAGRETTSDREDFFTDIPARTVGEIDPKTQTVKVQPLFKKRLPDGTYLDYPELPRVPVNFTRTANGGVTFPIPEGTRVNLSSSSRNMENYDVDDNGEPADTRSFALSDVRANLAGGETVSKPLKNFDPKNIHLRANEDGTLGMKFSPDGRFKHLGSHGDIYDLVAQVVELLAADTLVIKYGSSAGSGHALQFQAQYAEIAGKLRAMHLDDD